MARLALLPLVLNLTTACSDPAPGDGARDEEPRRVEAPESPAPSAPASAPVDGGDARARRIAAMIDAWPTEPSYRARFSALDPARTWSKTTTSRYDPLDVYGGLPREPGYEEVAVYCSACHGLAIVMQQRATPERWRETLDWMVMQGMPPLPEDVDALVHGYLSRHFAD